MFPLMKMPKKWVFRPYLNPAYQTPLIYMFLFFFAGVEPRSPEFQEPLDSRSNPYKGGGYDAILPLSELDRRLQEDCAKDAREGLRVLMSLRVDFGPMG